MFQTLPTADMIEGRILAVWREPFSLGSPRVEIWEPGVTVAQMVEGMICQRGGGGLPAEFRQFGIVMINGHEVSRAHWRHVRPKPSTALKPVDVTFHLPVQGGGSQGRKSIFALVAAIALTFVTGGIAAAGIPSLGIAAGSLGAKLLAGAVGIAGALVIGALTAPPVRSAQNADKSDAKSLEPVSTNGNVLEPNAPIPRVIGTRRIFPPFAYEPVVELIGQDEYVEAVHVLAGPHKLEDIRLGDTTWDDAMVDSDLQIETREGLPGERALQLTRRQGRTFDLNTEMSVHGTDPENLDQFAVPLPVWHGMATADAPDEAWLHMLVVGLTRQQAPSALLRIPFRIRMRRRGDSAWRYLPELHYMDATQAQRRVQVKFIFGTAFEGTLSNPSQNRGFVEARKFVPAQTALPVGADWFSDPYFSAGAGNDVYRFGTNETTNVRNILLTPDTVTVYLSEGDWPTGIYEIEIIRGATFLNSNFTSATYVYSGNVLDFYGNTVSNALPLTREGLLDRVSLRRIVSIRKQYPINQKNLALIAVRARNRAVGRLSVKASGYVRDWDGERWGDFVTTSNPAPHFFDVLTGALNFDPMPEEIIDMDGLVEWRQACIDHGYSCDMVAEGEGLDELLRIIASCGYARPYQSEIWGVIRDFDRSAEVPVQVFSPRNMSGFSFQKAFARVPAGLRVNYRDEEVDYSAKQILVYRKGADGTDARTEQVSYEGLVDEVSIIRRARFDLAQAEHRSTFYSFTAPVEALVCRRGSLVAVTHDVLQRQYGYARIVDLILDGDEVTPATSILGLVLDASIEVKNAPGLEAVTDMLAVPDMLEVGLQTGIAIRRAEGAVTVHRLSNAAGETREVMFEEPVALEEIEGGPFDGGPLTSAIAPGCLVVAGLAGREYRRLIVSEIVNGKDLTANLTLVDEAPQIWMQ